MGDATIPLIDLRHAALKAVVPTVIMPANGLLSDPLGRPLRDLRISVTDRCNFRCSYCMPKEVFDSQYRFLPQSSLLSFEEITRTARVFATHGVHKLRLTGGEPLLRKHLEVLVGMLAELRTPDGQPLDLTLTTNASLLTRKAQALKDAGLDSLPGAGAEILVDRVRRLVSNGKCGADEWLDIMAAAHQLHITTSATMMFGHVETLEERFIHLERIREVQSKKPADAKGFLAFIPWTFQDVDTLLAKIRGVQNLTTSDEYIRMIAISRIMLPNILNIQASWLTVGKSTAQICLHAGANDFGSIMLEENVVSAAGAPHRFTYKTIQDAIREAGFEPQLRNQEYAFREIPENIEEQVINY